LAGNWQFSSSVFRVKYVFGLFIFSDLELVNFKILDQFSHSSFEIRGFSHFNQILLILVDISNAFHNSIWLTKAKMCQTLKTTQIQYWNTYKI